MRRLKERRVTAARMREIDRLTQERFGIPEMILMEHAGTAVAEEVLRMARRRAERKGRVLLLCGGGANGGDGFVAARHLDNRGVPVEVLLVADPARIRGAARMNLEILKKLGVKISLVSSPQEWKRWALRKRAARVVVDALLGTGVSGDVRQPVRSVIGWVNRQRRPVVAVDLPSGISSDTGAACGTAVRATSTVTFGFPKVGLTRGAGVRHAGQVRVADISIPRALR